MALILDTGPLVANVDRSDPDHDRCRELINAAKEVRIVPVCTLVEMSTRSGHGAAASPALWQMSKLGVSRSTFRIRVTSRG